MGGGESSYKRTLTQEEYEQRKKKILTKLKHITTQKQSVRQAQTMVKGREMAAKCIQRYVKEFLRRKRDNQLETRVKSKSSRSTVNIWERQSAPSEKSQSSLSIKIDDVTPSPPELPTEESMPSLIAEAEHKIK